MKIFVASFVLALFVQSSLGQKDIVDLLADLGITTLKTNLDTAGLTAALKSGTDQTLFAPTDQAFTDLPQDIKDRLADVAFLTSVLKYHAAAVKAMSTDLKNEMLVDSLETGKQIRINIYQSGSVITASGSQVTDPDKEGTNGVVHVVNKVLLPPEGTVVDVATSAGLSNLTELVVLANLATTLSGGNLTVFAPTNTAFGKIDKATLDGLKNDIPALTNVLKYHVLDGTVFSVGLANTQDVPTLYDGKTLKIVKSGDSVTVNGFAVTMPNIITTNGVVHVLDDVLIPEEEPSDAAWGLQSSLMVALVTVLMAFVFRQ